MPNQSQPENSSVVGEDGELLQPDTTVDPDAYAEFVATYAHHDPLLFRMRENVRTNGRTYLFFAPWIMLLGSLVLGPVLTKWQQEVVNFIFYASFVLMWIVAVCYIAFKPR